MIYKNISLSDFRNEFKECERDYFSHEGYQVLFNYYETIGEDFELDVIAICCEWTEYPENEFILNYSYLLDDSSLVDVDMDNEKEIKLQELVEILEDKTTIFKLVNGSYLVMDF